MFVCQVLVLKMVLLKSSCSVKYPGLLCASLSFKLCGCSWACFVVGPPCRVLAFVSFLCEVAVVLAVCYGSCSRCFSLLRQLVRVEREVVWCLVVLCQGCLLTLSCFVLSLVRVLVGSSS